MKNILYSIPVWVLIATKGDAEPTATVPPPVTLSDFKLAGDLGGDRASFVLTATARVDNPKGGSLDLLSGVVALTDFSHNPKWHVRAESNRFLLVCDHSGKFPIQLKFDAALRNRDVWKSVDFRVAPCALQQIVLRGLAAETQFEFEGAARPERKGGEFVSYLPADGAVKLSWKEARPSVEGKLFYAAEMLSQIAVSPGLMRQVALLDFKIMQGELTQVGLVIRGAGEVTRVQGDQVLAWNVAPIPNSTDRRLSVQFNQLQKDRFSIQVQMQTPLGAFPQSADALRLMPDGATRFAGYFRIVNEGAVRLEVEQASGVSQVSPEQFPQTDATKTILHPTGNQQFAYRFSGADYALRIQADQILPELSVSELLAYHLGENELSVDGEFELDIREAPLRELVLRVPKGYAVARLNAPGLSDYFLSEPAEQPEAELRLVYGQPALGRQLVQLRLERNKPLAEAGWPLPRIEVARAKSVRGQIGVASDAGFRLTPERTQALTEIATALFPRQLPGIQTAFRLSDAAWQATMRVERLPQTVQADVLHIFSIGEGVAYGSSVINYVISGAPMSAFKVEVSDEYFNVEFTGKDLRNWQKIEGGYLVQLHTPVAGAYTLLATYERPFKAQGETLAFAGARPLDAQSEQGHTIIISAYQFEVKPMDVSSGLLPLEPGEVPPQYRLFFDAPILRAYHYGSRPFNLKLALSPLAQGDSLSQVVDRASLTTRITKEGQVLTDVRYFVKNRGNPNLRLTLPKGTDLWSAAVNGVAVVPVTDAQANLIPLPPRADPNAVLTLDLKLASQSPDAKRIRIDAPKIAAPVMLAEWKLEPETGQRLAWRNGSLTPAGGVPDISGFAQMARTFSGDTAGRAVRLLLMGLGLLAAVVVVWRWTVQRAEHKFSARHVVGTLLGVLALVMAAAVFIGLEDLVEEQKGKLARDVVLLAPVQQATAALSVEVGNVADKTSLGAAIGYAWPVLFGLALWAYRPFTENRLLKSVCLAVGWTLAGWAALRIPNGASAFLGVMALFLILHAVVPALRQLWQLPRRPAPAPLSAPDEGAAPAAAALIIGGVIWLTASNVMAGPSIPTGLHLSAQGCPARREATLGPVEIRGIYPEGVAAQTVWRTDTTPSGLIGTLKRRPRVAHPSQPWAEGYNPFGIGVARGETIEDPCSEQTQPRPTSRLLGIRADESLSHVRQEFVAPPVSCHDRLRGARVRLCGVSDSSKSVRYATDTSSELLADSVIQDIRVEDKFALATAKIHWLAGKDEELPLLAEPAVLTEIHYASNALNLVQAPGPSRSLWLVARRKGTFDVELHYQLQVTTRDTDGGFLLPVRQGLINRLNLTVANLDVDVFSPQAVSVRREVVGSNTVATLVLAPAGESRVGWKPRSRDVRHEKPVFYAEISQLYAPTAGVIGGAHYVSIRPAQGELSEVVLDVPAGATITDVLDPARSGQAIESKSSTSSSASLVSLWRFDPDTRKLRVSLNPPQSRPFALLVRSQVATGPLPFEQPVGLLSIEDAAGQIGLLGVATGNEVQLDSVLADSLSPINLEDFPTDLAASLQGQNAGLTVRRAFRYSDPKSTASIKASAVEPDVRVEFQNTLSLGEDRTVLASELTADISRAGIFKLSFVMPAGYDIETISGPALSHWTEAKTDEGRVITLHLADKTEGQRQFSISLSGPGAKATNLWSAPQLVIREASKQRGTLLIVPEQGLRLQVVTRDGVTQLDPQKSGIRQQGVLAFRVLQTPANLALAIEQVEPWVQVTSLQHAVVSEAEVKVTANLQYQIENTGLKSFRVLIPTNAQNVRFQGEQVADFLLTPGAATNGLQQWEVKLHRRVIGPYFLQATYQTLIPDQDRETILRGVQAAGVNLQRGFVTVEAGGRLQATVDTLPAALQPTEWQSIPRALQRDLQASAANFAYRLVEPSFQLPLKLERHEAARLLQAHVNSITFTSAISDDGVMLTGVRLEMQPGDKRLLSVALPRDAQFWFAFVNQNGVWPWRDGTNILIPLEAQARSGKAAPVELFYSSRVGTAGTSSLDLELLAPKLDLPLENITWRVSLSEKWQVKHWSGSLQLQQEETVPQTAAVDLQNYLQNEAGLQRERTKEAEDLLAAGNSALEQGDPQQARRAFQSAYGLSTSDAAFNEDARVQLHKIKLQQALVGLNVRQAETTGNPAALGGKFRDLRGRKELNYTQQDAKDIIDRNTADDNAAYMHLAEKIIQQQDAAVTSPAALRANIPVQGRLLTFTRTVLVDKWADLKLSLTASAVRAASWGARSLTLLLVLVLVLVLQRVSASSNR
jgi:hypothetical protein